VYSTWLVVLSLLVLTTKFQTFIVVRRSLKVASIMLRYTLRDQFSETVEYGRGLVPLPPFQVFGVFSTARYLCSEAINRPTVVE
jgi:hypothetical protein